MAWLIGCRYSSAPTSDKRERSPEEGMGVGELDLALRVLGSAPIDQGEHGAAQGLGPFQGRIVGLGDEQADRQFPGRTRVRSNARLP